MTEDDVTGSLGTPSLKGLPSLPEMDLDIADSFSFRAQHKYFLPRKSATTNLLTVLFWVAFFCFMR